MEHDVEQVVKALRCNKNKEECKECRYQRAVYYCDDIKLRKDAADLLTAQQKRIEELEEKRRWIPVEEPPKKNQQVLIYMPRIGPDDLWRERREAWFKDGKFYIPATGEEFFGITKWHPLPAPPEKGE